MTKLVKNLIIGGSATTVLAGGGTGIALALSGKKSSNSNNAVVARTTNVNAPLTQAQQEFIKTISGTPNKNVYTGFHKANVRDEVKKLDNNLLVSQQNAEIKGRTFFATQMQTPALPTQQHSLVSPELAAIMQANMDKLVAEGNARNHELVMKQKADKKAEDKAIAEALQQKVESDRVAALPEGTKDLKEGTKLDFVTSNMEYEIKKQAATDAEYARVTAETEARHADLVNAFNKREADKDLKQLYSKIATENIAQIELIKKELTELANKDLHLIERAIDLEAKKEILDARSLYFPTINAEKDRLTEHDHATEQQRQALIQDKVNEVQGQIGSQISTIFGNHPLTIEHSIVETLKTLNAGTQTFRYGTDLISMFGNAGSTALNKILNSLEVDGVKFGIKTFIQDGKLNILAVAIDNNGHELTTSSHTPVKIDFVEPTRPISATSSAQDMKFALAVALKENQDSHKDIISIAQDLILKLSNSETLNVANGVVAEGDVDTIIKSAITSLESTRRAGLPSKTEEMYPYILNRAIELIDAEIQKGHISYAGYTPIQGVDTHLAADHAREVFRAEALKIMAALNSVRNGY